MDHAIELSIITDNAAFGDTYEEQAFELARILRDVADRLEHNPSYLEDLHSFPAIRDSNGNTVGSITNTTY